MSSHLLYESKHAIRTFTVAPELQFHISDPRGKNHLKCQFLFVSQNNDLTLKLNPNSQQESKSMLGFQNKAPNIKLLKFQANQDNNAYLKKHDFQ